MFGATLADGLVKLLDQRLLVLGQLDRRLHRDVTVEVAGVAGSHTLAA